MSLFRCSYIHSRECKRVCALGIGVVLSVLCASCSLHRSAVDSIRERSDFSRTDSVSLSLSKRDSVFVFSRGDTIIIREYHYTEHVIERDSQQSESQSAETERAPIEKPYIPRWVWAIIAANLLEMIFGLVVFWLRLRR